MCVLAKNLKMLSLVVGIAASFLVSSAYAESWVELENKENALGPKLQETQTQIRETSIRLDQLSKEIQTLKSKQHQNPTLIRRYRLEALLGEAQEISNQLDKLSKKQTEFAAEMKKIRNALVVMIDRDLEKQRSIANNSNSALELRRRAAIELDRLSTKRMQLTLSYDRKPLPAMASGLTVVASNPEEAAERLNVVRDFEQRLKSEVASLESELDQAKRQKFMRYEVSHLLEEESFFGEQGFVRTATRNGKTDTAALAKSSTEKGTTLGAPGAAGSPAPSTVGASPVAGSASNGVPSASSSPASGSPSGGSPSLVGNQGAPGSNANAINSPNQPTGTANPADATHALTNPPAQMAPQQSLLETQGTSALLQNNNERDPLARLANELGVNEKEIKTLSMRRDPREDRVKWLQIRLDTTRHVLQRLEEFARNLEVRVNN